MKYGLNDTTIEAIQKVFEINSKIDEVILFGSRAKGNYKEGSDIDLALKGRNINFDDIHSLSRKLDELNLPYKIDLINYSTIKDKDVVEHIDRVGIVFFNHWKVIKFGTIPFNWKFIPATEFCLKVTDGTHDSPKQQPTGKYLITSKHIKGRNIDFEHAYLISENDYDKINLRSSVDQWDVIISMIGEYCGFSFVERNKEINYAVKNVGLFKTGNKDKAFWLYYFLNSNIGRFILEINKSGTSQPYISLGALRELPILIPNSEKEGEQIVDVLRSLDDKIDFLHRQNKTLEQLAETLFRQWFVEEAEYSWELGKIDDVVSVKGGTTPSTTKPEYWDGNIYWTSPRDLSNSDSIFLFDTERKISEIGLAQIGSGLLPIGTVLLSSRAPIGYLTITEIPVAINQGYIAIICDKIVSNYFMFLWCKANMNDIENAGNGSVFQEISKTAFKSLDILIPTKEKIKEFDKTVEPIFSKIKSNIIQIKQLTQLKDTLLPKLMSGEVKVKS